jgi:hypothetical protein
VKKLIRQKGRPELPDELKRNVRVNVFVTRAEYEQLVAAAKKAGKSVVDYVRDSALGR